MEQISHHPRATPAAAKGGSTTSNMPPAGSVTKRLSNELMALMMSSPPGISAFPSSDENIFEWVGRLEGSPSTVYEGLAFKISISFPANYPFTAPTIKFTTPCFHPNVSSGGDICLDILKEKWSAVYSVQTVLVSLQSLLGEPNNDSPLCVEAAELWDDPRAFKLRLMQLYRPIIQ